MRNSKPFTDLPPYKLGKAAFLALEAKINRVGRQLYPPRVKPDWIEVRPIRLKLPRLRPEFHGYRLVHISDLHTDTGLTQAHLAEVVKLVNQQQPDMVAITGDFVSYHAGPYAADMINALSQLAPREATLAVLGNHDYWSDAKVIRQVIRQSGIIELDNACYTLRRGQAQLHIAGVDDFWEGHARLERVIQQMPADGAAILLAHEPDFADVSAAAQRFDLQLSGHSHGGQIILPILGPVFRPPHGVKYPVGYYRVGEMGLYTNRGLGTAFLRVRYNCRAEITVFTLEAGWRTDYPAKSTF